MRRAIPFVLLPILLLALGGHTLGREVPIPTAARASPWALAATPDGRRLLVACAGRSAVVVLDVEQRRVEREILVGGEPRGLAIAPDGRTFAATVAPTDDVVLIDASSLEVRERIPVGRGPEGLAYSADGSRLFVALGLEGRVEMLDLVERKSIAGHPAGREPFIVRRSADGRHVAAVSRRATVAPPHAEPSSAVVILDGGSGEVVARANLPSIHLSEDAAFTPDGERLLVPGLRVRNLLPVVQVARGWVVSAVLAVVDARTGAVRVVPLTEPERGFSDPGGIAVDEAGGRIYVASGGGREVGVFDLDSLLEAARLASVDAREDFSIASRALLRRIPVGWNPRGVARIASPRGICFAVSERLDDSIVLLDPEGEVLDRIDLAPPMAPDARLRGERAFHDASYCFQESFSCRSCHPEAHTDGLTYDFEIDGVGDHVVLNRSLRGLAGTSPFKWTGINPTLQRQCGARFAMVLTRARVFPPQTLDDMAAWLLSLPPPRSALDPSKTTPDLRAAVERGRAIFARSRDNEGRRLRPTERCITCHPPPLFTNRQKTDVGTRGARDPTGAFDVPHLLGTGSNAPYLHDGRALTLEAIWTESHDPDRHGRVSDLTPQQFADLVTYLRAR